MRQSPESQDVQASGHSTQASPGAMYAWAVTFRDKLVPVFFHSHCGPLTFEGQRMVLGSWWCSLELWGGQAWTMLFRR